MRLTFSAKSMLLLAVTLGFVLAKQPSAPPRERRDAGMTNPTTVDQEKLISMVKDHKLIFVPFGLNKVAPDSATGVAVFRNHHSIGRISVSMTSGKLISDITDQPDIEPVLEYIRYCLRTYKNAYAGLDDEEDGSKLYLLYKADDQNGQ